MQIVQHLMYRPDGLKAALVECMRYGPGWTLTLAAIRTVFGTLATYWFTPLAFVGLHILLYRFLRRIVCEPIKALFCTIFTASVLLTAYQVSPHYLLYPFRGTYCYFLVFLGYALAGSLALREISLWRIFLAALCFAYAILVREPMVFVCAALFIYILTAKVSWRWKSLLVYSAPFVLPLMLFAVVGAVTGSFGTDQLDSWWRFLKMRSEHGLLDIVGRVAVGILYLGYEALDWWGVLLVIAGIWGFRRQRDVLLLLVVPAVLLFAFYALYDVAHRRYTLSILLFIVPVAASGAVYLVDLVLARFSLKSRREIQSRVYMGLSILCLGLLGFKGLAMDALWSLQVGADEMQTLKQEMKTFAKPGDVVCTGWYYSQMGEAVSAQTPYQLVMHPREVAPKLAQGHRCFFLKPSRDGAAVNKPRPYYKVPFESLLRHRFTLTPVEDDAGAHVALTINGFAYEVYEVRAWVQQAVAQEWKPKPRDARFLWMNFGAAQGEKSVEVLCAGQDPVRWSVPAGQGYTLAALPPSYVGQAISFKATGAEPLPPSPLMGFQTNEKFVFLDLAHGRDLSVASFFPEPFVQFNVPESAQYIAVFQGEATVQFPPILGEVGGMDVSLSVGVYPDTEQPMQLEYWRGNSLVSEQEIQPGRRSSRHYVAIPLDQGVPASLTLRVKPAEADATYIRIYDLGIRLR
jgi:hypothetical protein